MTIFTYLTSTLNPGWKLLMFSWNSANELTHKLKKEDRSLMIKQASKQGGKTRDNRSNHLVIGLDVNQQSLEQNKRGYKNVWNDSTISGQYITSCKSHPCHNHSQPTIHYMVMRFDLKITSTLTSSDNRWEFSFLWVCPVGHAPSGHSHYREVSQRTSNP